MVPSGPVNASGRSVGSDWTTEGVHVRRLTIILVSILGLLLSAGAVAAAQQETLLDGKVRTGDSISIGAGETIDDDLYVFGGTVDVNGTITGDLIVFGGQVRIDGTVNGDVMAGSGTVDVNGTVGGDVRVGAGQLNIDGTVGEDVFAGAGQIGVSGEIGGDLVFGAGQVRVDGVIGGDVLGSTGDYDRSGTVGGSENVTIEQPAEREQPNILTRWLERFASLLVLGLIIMWASRSLLERSVTAIDTRLGSVVVRGLIALAAVVVLPIAVTVAAALLAALFAWIGLDLLVGLMIVEIVVVWLVAALLAFVFVVVIAPVTVAVWAGNKALPDDTAGYLALAVGLAVLVALQLVPILGGLVGLVVTIVGAGAWMILLPPLRRSKADRSVDPAAAQPAVDSGS